MSSPESLSNGVREARLRRGWSQDELAERSGVSRAGVSAIELQRLVPSVAAALSIAAALGCRVEDLFQSPATAPGEAAWAWPPQREPARYWEAVVARRRLRYPVEATVVGVQPHDGVFRQGRCKRSQDAAAPDTIVMASCDPAAGLLARHVERATGLRLLVLPRSSRLALELLKLGLVHAAGVHLTTSGERSGNAAAVRDLAGPGFGLLRIARWQEGVAIDPQRKIRTVAAALKSRLRWVGREPGSGARQCFDELLPDRKPQRVAFDHRGVAEAIRCGWAEAGVCVRLVGEEAGLDFLPVRDEAYELCLPADADDDSKLRALIEVVQSPSYRQDLAELPGYDSSTTGQWHTVS